jgi:hypothetical protein
MNYFSIILISTIICSIVETYKINKTQEICVKNQFPRNSINYLNLCYLNNIEDQYILVWFTIGRSLNDTFDFYRFVLRLIDKSSSSHAMIEELTNFTKLIDFNNSLRMFNLDTGEYEVCIEFQSDSPHFIYQPRDGCISILIGRSFYQSFEQSSTPLLIALASGIVIFFILGLVVQSVKKRRGRIQNDENQSQSLSAISLKQQREHLIKSFFRRYIDQPRASRMHQWARNRAFRHLISTEEPEFDRPNLLRRWSRHLIPSISRHRMSNSEPVLTANIIRTISVNEDHQISPRKVSFHLSPPEEYEMV